MFNKFLPRNSCRLWDDQTTDDSMAHAHGMLDI